MCRFFFYFNESHLFQFDDNATKTKIDNELNGKYDSL